MFASLKCQLITRAWLKDISILKLYFTITMISRKDNNITFNSVTKILSQAFSPRIPLGNKINQKYLLCYWLS